MKIKIATTCALAAIIITPAIASEITDKTDTINAKLGILNSLGEQCQAQLMASPTTGPASEDCAKYVRNMNGAYFSQGVSAECSTLLKWYESQRQTIIANPNMADNEPERAQQLVKDMKAVSATCSIENFQKHKHLTKPLNTINAASGLE